MVFSVFIKTQGNPCAYIMAAIWASRGAKVSVYDASGDWAKDEVVQELMKLRQSYEAGIPVTESRLMHSRAVIMRDMQGLKELCNGSSTIAEALTASEYNDQESMKRNSAESVLPLPYFARALAGSGQIELTREEDIEADLYFSFPILSGREDSFSMDCATNKLFLGYGTKVILDVSSHSFGSIAVSDFIQDLKQKSSEFCDFDPEKYRASLSAQEASKRSSIEEQLKKSSIRREERALERKKQEAREKYNEFFTAIISSEAEIERFIEDKHGASEKKALIGLIRGILDPEFRAYYFRDNNLSSLAKQAAALAWDYAIACMKESYPQITEADARAMLLANKEKHSRNIREIRDPAQTNASACMQALTALLAVNTTEHQALDPDAELASLEGKLKRAIVVNGLKNHREEELKSGIEKSAALVRQVKEKENNLRQDLEMLTLGFRALSSPEEMAGVFQELDNLASVMSQTLHHANFLQALGSSGLILANNQAQMLLLKKEYDISDYIASMALLGQALEVFIREIKGHNADPRLLTNLEHQCERLGFLASSDDLRADLNPILASIGVSLLSSNARTDTMGLIVSYNKIMIAITKHDTMSLLTDSLRESMNTVTGNFGKLNALLQKNVLVDHNALAPILQALDVTIKRSCSAMRAEREQYQASLSSVAKGILTIKNDLNDFMTFLSYGSGVASLSQALLDSGWLRAERKADDCLSQTSCKTAVYVNAMVGLRGAVERFSDRIHALPIDEEAKETIRKVREQCKCLAAKANDALASSKLQPEGAKEMLFSLAGEICRLSGNQELSSYVYRIRSDALMQCLRRASKLRGYGNILSDNLLEAISTAGYRCRLLLEFYGTERDDTPQIERRDLDQSIKALDAAIKSDLHAMLSKDESRPDANLARGRIRLALRSYNAVNECGAETFSELAQVKSDLHAQVTAIEILRSEQLTSTIEYLGAKYDKPLQKAQEKADALKRDKAIGKTPKRSSIQELREAVESLPLEVPDGKYKSKLATLTAQLEKLEQIDSQFRKLQVKVASLRRQKEDLLTRRGEFERQLSQEMPLLFVPNKSQPSVRDLQSSSDSDSIDSSISYDSSRLPVTDDEEEVEYYPESAIHSDAKNEPNSRSRQIIAAELSTVAIVSAGMFPAWFALHSAIKNPVLRIVGPCLLTAACLCMVSLLLCDAIVRLCTDTVKPKLSESQSSAALARNAGTGNTI